MTQTELRGGDLLGRYELLLPIAKGGMATVWLARLTGTRGFRKIVAVKTILPGVLDDARLEQMFIEEATLASQIHHPNVVGILDFGEHNGTLFQAMEWVEGEPVNAVVAEASKHGGLPMSIAVNVIGQACKGLHAAHELRDEAGVLLGVVHRDISPQNIIVSHTGIAKVLDFGIAKATARASTLTEIGEVKGKFAFMAPEQVQGHALDRRSDIFSLGVLAYMLTTGRHPFRGQNTADTVRKISSSELAPLPSSFVPDYPEALEAAIVKAIAKNPGDRWATAHDFLEALEQAAPDCMESSFELEIASYMSKLFAGRIAERRRQLRLAEERSGRVDLSASNSGSNSSLGAVAIDGARTGASNPGLAVPDSGRVSSDRPTQVAPPASRGRKALIYAPIALAVFGLGFGVRQTLLAGVANTQRSHAAAQPALDGAPRASAVAAPEFVPSRSLPTLPETSAETGTSTASSAVTRTQRRAPVAVPARGVARAAAPAPSPAPAAPAQLTPPAPAAAPAQAAPPAAQPPPAPPNSWDPSTFGGRH